MTKRLAPAAAVLAVSLLSAAGAQAAVYSNASLKGSYGYLAVLHTANSSTVLHAHLGIGTFDGAGNVTMSDSDVAMGVVTKTSGAGVYTVNSDGSGTISISGGPTIAILIDHAASGIATDAQLLTISDTANEVVTGHAVIQSTVPKVWTLKDTKGRGYVTVNAVDPAGPQTAALAVNTSTGTGTFNSSLTIMYNGMLTRTTGNGTLTINSDGTGTSSVTVNGTKTNDIVVFNSLGAMSVVVGIPYNYIEYAESHR